MSFYSVFEAPWSSNFLLFKKILQISENNCSTTFDSLLRQSFHCKFYFFLMPSLFFFIIYQIKIQTICAVLHSLRRNQKLFRHRLLTSKKKKKTVKKIYVYTYNDWLYRTKLNQNLNANKYTKKLVKIKSLSKVHQTLNMEWLQIDCTLLIIAFLN